MSTESLTFAIGPDGHSITVSSWDELLRWVERESAQWEWLIPGDGLTDVGGWASTIRNQWAQLHQQVFNSGTNGEPIGSAHAPLSALSPAGQLLASASKDGRLVLDIRGTGGDKAAAFAFAFLKQAVQINSAVDREMLLGAVLTALPEFGPPAELAARLQRERANTRSSMLSLSAKLEGQDRDRAGAAEVYLHRGARIAARVLRRRRDGWKVSQDVWAAAASSAVTDIRTVENTYREAMRLQAPVEYWRNKGLAHGSKEGTALVRLLWFFPLATIVILAAFGVGAWIILANEPGTGERTPVALYVVISGALAFLSTNVFWVGRLLTKLYLSEHHLRNDAEERAIMTETYLALTNEGAAADNDRQIVLNALFRNTLDGIVKDEGPSDLNVQALLARLLTK